MFHLAVCATLFNHTNTRNLASWAGRLHNSTTAEPCIIVRARAAARSTPSRYCYRACTRHGRAGVTRRRCAKTLQCEALRCNRPRTLAGAARGPACPQTATWSRRRAWPSGLYFQWAWTGDWTKHQCCHTRKGTATRQRDVDCTAWPDTPTASDTPNAVGKRSKGPRHTHLLVRVDRALLEHP